MSLAPPLRSWLVVVCLPVGLLVAEDRIAPAPGPAGAPVVKQPARPPLQGVVRPPIEKVAPPVAKPPIAPRPPIGVQPPIAQPPVIAPPIDRIRPPVPVPVEFQLKVETKPRFPGQARPEASEPASDRDLSIVIQPEKKQFAGNGPLAFEVVLTNKSDKPLRIPGAGHLGLEPRLVVANLKTSAQWTVTGATKATDRAQDVVLAAGKSVTYTVVVEGPQFIAPPNPIPVPLPRPVPLPIGIPQPRPGVVPGNPGIRKGVPEAEAPAAVQPIAQPVARPLLELQGGPAPPDLNQDRPRDEVVKDPVQRRPAIGIVVGGTLLPCGTGACRARLLLEFKPVEGVAKPGPAVDATREWTGKLASQTVDFEVGPAEAVPFPQPGVLNKEQAVQQAAQAAEQALSSVYRPNEGFAPAHTGAWIENPAKSAEVKDLHTGGWSVSWTQVPKAGGFNYAVTVDVTPNGGTQVKSAFAAYSLPKKP